jgi:Domain of unknown function (DUF4167)
MKPNKHANGKRPRGGRFYGRRGPGGGGGGGGRQGRHIESNGPEGRVAGSVDQVVERYLALARDARSSGDYVAAENFLQHADHYTRLANVGREQRAAAAGPQPSGEPEERPAEEEEEDATA